MSLVVAAALEAEVLPADLDVHGELVSDGVKVFTLEAPVGATVEVLVDQRGVDIGLVVEAGDGSEVGPFDSPLDRRGLEVAQVTVRGPGRPRVQVRAREVGAPGGDFSIRWRRAADPRSTHRAAQNADAAAGKAYAAATATSLRAAQAAYQRAAEGWAEAGEERRRARATYAAAVVARLVDDLDRAWTGALAAREAWSKLDLRWWVAATDNEIGLLARLRDEPVAARDHFAAALAAFESLDDPYGRGVARANLCLMALSSRRLRDGLACYEQAVPDLQTVGATSLEAAAQVNLGRVHDLIGEPDAAYARYERALALARLVKDVRAEARALNNLGVMRRQLGDPEAALDHYQAASTIFRRLEDRRWEARVASNVGAAYRALGEPGRAESHFRRALELWRASENERGEASTLVNVALARLASAEAAGTEGDAEGATALRADAERLLEQAQAIWQQRDDAREVGNVLSLRAAARLAAGDPRASSDLLVEALERLRISGDRVREGTALRRLGEAALALGDLTGADRHLARAVSLAAGTGHETHLALARFAQARVAVEAGRPRAAWDHVAAAIENFESLRATVGDPDLRATLSATHQGTYALAIDLLMGRHAEEPDAGHDAAALALAEHLRGRTLYERLAALDPEAATPDAPLAYVAKRRQLEGRLGAKIERLVRVSHGGDPAGAGPERSRLNDEIEALHRELDVVERRLQRHASSFARPDRKTPLDIAEMRRELEAETALMVFHLGEAQSWLWVLGTGRQWSFRLPGRAEIELPARRWREQLEAPGLGDRTAQRDEASSLVRATLEPARSVLSRFERWVVVADGALHRIPFEALPWTSERRTVGPVGADRTMVGERFEVAYLPSLSVLQLQRRRVAERPAAPRKLAVIADPVFGTDDQRVARRRGTSDEMPFERLPATRDEALALRNLVGSDEGVAAWLGFEARRDRVLGDGLAAFRVVHFATHGVVDDRQPSLSGLALSMIDETGAEVEGFLRLGDVYRMRLGSELVVLSGCRTAAGRALRGEGVVGLVQAFLSAGSARVVASAWAVEDRATAALMTRFYQAMWRDGERPARALRTAKEGLRRDRRYRDPYYWAGFSIYGDWR